MLRALPKPPRTDAKTQPVLTSSKTAQGFQTFRCLLEQSARKKKKLVKQNATRTDDYVWSLALFFAKFVYLSAALIELWKVVGSISACMPLEPRVPVAGEEMRKRTQLNLQYCDARKITASGKSNTSPPPKLPTKEKKNKAQRIAFTYGD